MTDVVEPSAEPGQQVRESTDAPVDDEPVLPRVTRDEAAGGWGERPDDDRSDDWYLRERPPHHEG